MLRRSDSVIPTSRRRARAVAVLGAAWLACAATGCATADLRPPALVERAEPLYPGCGRTLLARSAEAHGGEDAWRSLGAVEATFTDAYQGLIGTLACPWPDDPCRVALTFTPGTDVSAASFAQAGEPRRWGIHAWNTWRAEGEAPPSYSDGDERISFWLPTLQYFLEMPFRLPEGELVDCAGKARIDYGGRKVEVYRVYVTWGSYAPHPRLDQYLAYLDVETHRLLRADFTVRDLAGFARGSVVYQDYEEVEGFWLPRRVVIGSDPPEDVLHTLRVESWRLGVSTEGLVPDPSRPAGTKP